VGCVWLIKWGGGVSCLECFFDCRGWATVPHGVCMYVGSACVRVCARVGLWFLLMGLCRFEGTWLHVPTICRVGGWMEIACVYEDLLLSFPHCACACGARGSLHTRGRDGVGPVGVTCLV
jgi:hypothetical protein